ncbi:MAG: hypothetical protein AAF458_03710 [Pseudomonadota bacterium]
MKALAGVLYLLVLLPLRLLNRRTGLDPLMLRDDNRDSYWLALAPQDEATRYFDDSRVFGSASANRSSAMRLSRWLHQVSRRRWMPASRRARHADQDGSIPDENYTLW